MVMLFFLMYTVISIYHATAEQRDTTSSMVGFISASLCPSVYYIADRISSRLYDRFSRNSGMSTHCAENTLLDFEHLLTLCRSSVVTHCVC